MIANPQTRFWFLAVPGVAAALFVGVQLADGNVAPAIAVLLLPALVVMERWIPVGAAGLLLGGLLIGNVVGNRGFAQIAPLSPLPLFPAEIGLAAGFVWLAFRGAQAGRLPFRPDPLGFAVLVWIVLSSLRLPFDVRDHGLMALRDYALVYYAGFFFLAREAGAENRVRHALHHAWVIAIVTLAVVYPLYERFELFFLTQLTFRGIPAIAIKNDLAGTFAAAGAMYAAVRWAGSRKALWGVLLVVTLGLALYMVTRAAFVGMLVAVVFFMPRARVKVAQAIAVLAVLGGLVATVQVAGGERTWRETRLYDVYEHAVSLADVSGSRAYEGLESQDTGDNTQFRLVWWRLLIDRTLSQHLLTGAGFGADISSEFARDYLGVGASDFTARSPHNVLLTLFARSGLAGLLPFLAVVALFVREIWRRRQPDLTQHDPTDDVRDAAMGCSALVIFVSACFGVVLEGPMGAVVFWIALGLATARPLSGSKAGEEVAVPREVAPSLASSQDKPWQVPHERPNRTAAPDPS
jgi:hypothetical protein